MIATVTTVHAEQSIKAIGAGLHVLCEKPLSTNVDIVGPLSSISGGKANIDSSSQSQSVVDAANKRPDLKFMCGFSRRFDASYRDAFERVDSGAIGRPAVVRSQTCDLLDPSGFFVDYAQFSGGIFVDCNIHDIDLALWFLGQDVMVKSVAAFGITAVQPDLKKWGDVDNGVGIVEFYGGKLAWVCIDPSTFYIADDQKLLLLVSHDGSWPARHDRDHWHKRQSDGECGSTDQSR